jgi:hypothetical protein
MLFPKEKLFMFSYMTYKMYQILLVLLIGIAWLCYSVLSKMECSVVVYMHYCLNKFLLLVSVVFCYSHLYFFLPSKLIYVLHHR